MGYHVQKPCNKFCEGRKLEVEFPRYDKVMAVIARDPAMLHKNHMDGRHHCQMEQPRIFGHTGSAKELVHIDQTNADGHHQKHCHHHLDCHLPHPTLLWDLKLLTSIMCHPEMHIHMLLVNTLKSFVVDAYYKDTKHNDKCNSDLLTDERSSTG